MLRPIACSSVVLTIPCSRFLLLTYNERLRVTSKHLVSALQVKAKLVMEKVATLDRISGDLDSTCWSKLANSTEAVQHEFFKDLDNAATRSNWKVQHLSSWALRAIDRHTKACAKMEGTSVTPNAV